MIKFTLFIGLFFSLSCVNLHANELNKNVDSIARQLFVKSEQIAMRNRAKIEKMRFLDPVERNSLFFKIVQSESPDLINQTNKYKFGLISLLSDETIIKDDYTNFDIVNILYNLCIDDYVVAMDSVYSLVKANKLKFDILETMVIQDFNVSRQLVLNYQNPKVQQFMYKILHEIETGVYVISKENYDFVESVKKLISGKDWDIDFKKFEPLLNSKKCS